MLLHGVRGGSGPDIVGPSRGESGTMLNGVQVCKLKKVLWALCAAYNIRRAWLESVRAYPYFRAEEEGGRTGKGEGRRERGSPRVRNCFSKKVVWNE